MNKRSFLPLLVSPATKAPIYLLEHGFVKFKDGSQFPCANGIPILIDKDNSLFAVDEILAQKPQTQNKAYSDRGNFKNYVRRNLLPTLSKDFQLSKRYRALNEKISGGKVLIIGAGDKIDFYREIFNDCDVVTSDVHIQFQPDIVFDIHRMPFSDNTFDLVLAAQVFEHTIKPWVAAKEMERVTRLNGYMQIEVPFSFPYHGAPYDFFRFTFTGLRSLFTSSKVDDFGAPEGLLSACAVINSQVLIQIAKGRLLKYLALVFSRGLFFWLKYLDRLIPNKSISAFMMPKGYFVTFRKDSIERTEKECLDDFFQLTGNGKV